MWLEHCQACSVPEIASVFNRSRIGYDIVTGYLEDPEAWTEAARVSRAMRENRLGVLGHYYGGMMDVYTDLTKQSATFGMHIEMLEMCELNRLREETSLEQVSVKLKMHRP